MKVGRDMARAICVAAWILLCLSLLAFIVAVPVAIITQMDAPLWERISAAAFASTINTGFLAFVAYAMYDS